jgi:hypothetical protein
MFQFYAGDLYEVFDKVRDRYFASEPVSGNCKASLSSLKVIKSGLLGSFNISLNFDCELNVQRSKLANFAVALMLEIEGLPLASSIDFRLRSHN